MDEVVVRVGDEHADGQVDDDEDVAQPAALLEKGPRSRGGARKPRSAGGTPTRLILPSTHPDRGRPPLGFPSDEMPHHPDARSPSSRSDADLVHHALHEKGSAAVGAAHVGDRPHIRSAERESAAAIPHLDRGLGCRHARRDAYQGTAAAGVADGIDERLIRREHDCRRPRSIPGLAQPDRPPGPCASGRPRHGAADRPSPALPGRCDGGRLERQDPAEPRRSPCRCRSC